jgi:CRP-like cAMP-binding protein
MENALWQYLSWAAILGTLSAVALPMGSLIGINTRLRSLYISILAAFGAGALIAALTVDLVAPTVQAISQQARAGHHGNPYQNFVSLIIGAILGGILFIVLDQIVNAHGGFLRKTATTLTYFRTSKRHRMQKLLEEMSRCPLFHNFPTRYINTLLKMVRQITFQDGEVVNTQGKEADFFYLITEGKLSARIDDKPFAELGPGDVIGVLPFLTRGPYLATGIAQGTVKCLALSKEDFESLRHFSSEFDQACRNLANEHLKIIERVHSSYHAQASQWIKAAQDALKLGTDIPTTLELRRVKEEYHSAPLAIWLGILIDGIPESFVIGSGLLMPLQTKLAVTGEVKFLEVIPYTLIAGLFLSNFPEALSSSANMYNQGWSKGKIFTMWFSLMVMTALGAGLGFLLASELHHTWLVFAEGMAAGAMLTMIAAAMIPEAVHLGNASAVGFSTLAGFLAAILFKLFEA